MKTTFSSLNALAAAIACLSPRSAPASELPSIAHVRLPTIILETSGRQITATQRFRVSITLPNSTERCHAELSIRGSSSAKREKKPYRLELQDERGVDLKLSLLGMPKESDWILYPAYTDKTMIRDVLGYELWCQMGYWAPRTRYVHLFITTNSSSSSSSFSSSNVPTSRMTHNASVFHPSTYYLAEFLDKPKWLLDEHLTTVDYVVGYIPVRIEPHDTVFHIRLLPVRERDKMDIDLYIRVGEKVPREDFSRLLRGWPSSQLLPEIAARPIIEFEFSDIFR